MALTKHRSDYYMSKLELEYRNFMEAYFRMMSYKEKLECIEELSGDDKEKLNAIASKIVKKSEQIYKRLHIEK